MCALGRLLDHEKGAHNPTRLGRPQPKTTNEQPTRHSIILSKLYREPDTCDHLTVESVRHAMNQEAKDQPARGLPVMLAAILWVQSLTFVFE